MKLPRIIKTLWTAGQWHSTRTKVEVAAHVSRHHTIDYHYNYPLKLPHEGITMALKPEE